MTLFPNGRGRPRTKAYSIHWKYYKAKRDEWLAVNGPCRYCGSSELLEIDHIDPKTKITSNFWKWPAKRREEELAKCQVLCHSCHKEKSRIDVWANASMAP